MAKRPPDMAAADPPAEEPQGLAPGEIAPQEWLDEAAPMILNWMAACDPLWAEYITIARTELRRTDFQLCVSWIAYVMDNSAHMVTTNRPELEPGYAPRGAHAQCERCHQAFDIRWPGQRFCGNGNACTAPVGAGVGTGYDEA